MRTKGRFTLIEAIVVIITIGFLFFILAPGFERYFGPRYPVKVKCKANLKQLCLFFHIYCDDNNGSFSSGTAGTSSRDDWFVSLKPYYNVDTFLLKCPLAKERRPDGKDYGGPNNTYLVSIEKEGSQKISMESSYGLNCWVYNPPPDGNVVVSRPADNFWRTKDVPGVSKVPLFADGMWSGGYPEPNGLAGEPPQFNGQWDDVNAEMKHFCIDRHSGATNIVFMDGHAEQVGLKELWKLKWHKNYDTNGEWTQADAPWPEWLK